MKACFIGLGYIGLPTAIIAAGHDIEVIGVDINPAIVEKTNAARLHIVEPGLDELLKKTIASGKLRAQTTPEPADAFFIVVPTPFKDGHQPDISYVEAATRSVIPHLKEGDLFVIESTSPVGTTEQMADIIFAERPELKDKIYIAYCPERVLPGNVIYELVHNDRVIGGINDASTRKASMFYGKFVKGHLHPTNSRTAEMCKLTENSSRDVQIAFANELSMICEQAGINVWELIRLANRHPRVNILWPGAGVGGHCIAVDPYFITAAFPETARLIADARDINNSKAQWCADRIENAILRFRADNPDKTPVVALMGVAFKPDIDDLRESPARHIIDRVIERNPEARYMVVEPYVDQLNGLPLTDVDTAWQQADIVAFLTAHTPFKKLDCKDSRSGSREVLDFAGVFK
ncbi:MAG: UDP-N-acetyl-D-mannosamine dehydrogenase [Muribaculaceae bacterium]|nr:UDP-N-acetyl-D-mannosamine dehydrogenase [Muribaculaceae bacterium]